ncbi:MAG: helix-turn-helix domain-containing protein [Nitrososphaeria archaeon]|nr:helix-turn-helix domain-containing protein [Nitrososphaeria archaeon]
MNPRQIIPDLALVLDSIASPTRLKMLKSLAQRRLGYSELAKAVGMNRDKDAGKFSYHLKKLLSSGLIEVDASVGKYTLSNKGVLILKHLEKIEEELGGYSLMIVRRSDQLIEPFDKNKIVDALIKEAKLPPKLAREVASVAEKKLIDLKIDYLTAPLIRELVNSILLDMGLEKYRHRLTRLGMPLYDVTRLLKKSFELKNWKIFLEESSGSITREYLLIGYLPREVAELHLSGRIDIYPISNWIFGLFSKRFNLDASNDISKIAAEVLEESLLIKRELRMSGSESQVCRLLEIIGDKIPEKRIISLDFSEKLIEHITMLSEGLRRKLGLLIDLRKIDVANVPQLTRHLDKLQAAYVLSFSDDVGFSSFLLDHFHTEIHSIVTLNLLGMALESRGDLDLMLSKIPRYMEAVFSIIDKGLDLSMRIRGSNSTYSLISISGLMEASKYLARDKTQVIEEAVEIAATILERISELASRGSGKIMVGGRCPKSAARRFKRIDTYRYGEKQLSNLLTDNPKSYSTVSLPPLSNLRDLDDWIEYVKKLAGYFNGGCAINIKVQKSMRTLKELLFRISGLEKVNQRSMIFFD